MNEPSADPGPCADQLPSDRPAPNGPSRGLDLAVALDLVMLERGLSAEQAYELIRLGAERSGRDLHAVATDVIDLGTSRLPR
ncbi:ANTAR domain-containing protein [Terrabacter carboxydivorans]|uniref:ANTAR domain-containing protein n=1 Tax=Terrabacter carboxydivorans TaxID=619730 RepID=A0ABN3M3A1_9MICO